MALSFKILNLHKSLGNTLATKGSVLYRQKGSDANFYMLTSLSVQELPQRLFVKYKPVYDQVVDSNSCVAEERIFQYLKTREAESQGDLHLTTEDHQEGKFYFSIFGVL